MDLLLFGWLKALLLLAFAWLTSLMVLKLLRGDINLTGMLRRTEDGPIEPDRMQAFVLTIFGALYLAFMGVNEVAVSASMPEVPEFLLAGFAGSQATYLVGKAIRKMR